MSRRLAQLKKEVEDLTIRMQTFCLDPQYSDYVKISGCNRLRVLEGGDYDAWRLAVLYKYGNDWFQAKKIQSEEVEEAYEKFIALEKISCEAFMKRPTKSIVDRLWHFYFATGEFKYLDLLIQVPGWEGLQKSLKDYSADLYTAIRHLYGKTCNELLTKNKYHFNCAGGVDKFNFVDFDNYVAKKVQARKDDLLLEKQPSLTDYQS